MGYFYTYKQMYVLSEREREREREREADGRVCIIFGVDLVFTVREEE